MLGIIGAMVPEVEALTAVMEGTEVTRKAGMAFYRGQIDGRECVVVQSGIGTVVVSLGGDGALFVTRDAVLRGYGLKVDVQSTVGAGDSMLAALVCAKQRGMRFIDGCALAMAFSAAAVTTPGTQPAAQEVVDALLAQVRIVEL